MALAGTLVVDIAANVARLQQDMEKATGIVSSATRQMESAANTAKRALGGIAAGFTLGAFANMIRETIEWEGKLHDLAQASGSSASALSSMIDVAKQSGTDMTAVAGGMQKLSKSMAEAQDGTSKAAKVFGALKVATTDASGALRPTQQVMQELGQKLSSMKDQTLAVAFAQETMGKAGANLLPFLYELASAGQLQAKITDEQARAADQFGDNLVKLKSAGDQWKIHLVNEMTPGLVTFTERLIAAQKASGNLAAAMMLLMGANRSGNVAASLREATADIEKESGNVARLTKMRDEFAAMGPVQRAFSTDDSMLVEAGLAIAGTKQSLAMQRREYLLSVQRQEALAGDPAANMDARDRRLASALNVANPLGKDGPAAPKEEARDDFTPLSKSLDERIALMKAERDAVVPLSEAQKELVKVQTDLTLGYKTLTPAQLESVKGKLAEVDALDTLLKFKATQAAADKAEQQRLKERLNSQFQSIDAMDAEIKKLEEQNQEIGLSTTELGLLRVARIDDAIAIKERQAAQAEGNSADAAFIETIKIEIEQLRRLRDATSDNQFKTAVEEGNRMQREEAKRTGEYIQRSLTDALMRGFDSGKTFAQNLRDTTVNMFKSLVLEPMIRPIAAGAAGAVTSALGLSGSGGGIGNMFSTASGANTVSSWFGGPSISPGSLSSSLGMGGLFSSGASTSAVAGFDIALGGAGGSAGASSLAAGGLEAGGALAGLGTAMPYIGAALLAYSLMSSGGGGPKPSQLGVLGSPGQFYVSQNDVPGGEANLPLYNQLNALLNDPTKYDQSILAQHVGYMQGTPGEDANSMFQKLLSALQPAAVAAQETARAVEAETAAKKALNETLDVTKKTLLEAKDPVAYWNAEVAKSQKLVGTSASTVEAWRNQFLSVFDAVQSQAQLNLWNGLGFALQKAADAAGEASSAVALTTSSFATLVDFTRYQRLSANGIKLDARGQVIPHFAAGGFHAGGARVVGEFGPEIEITGPSRIMSNADSGRFFDVSALLSSLNDLRSDLRAANLSIARNTGETARLARRWEGNGIPVRAVDPTAAIEVNVVESVAVPVA